MPTMPDHNRQAMLGHLAAIEQAMALMARSPARSLLAQRATLLAADEWLRRLSPPADPELALKFGMFVTVLLLATEDVLRFWPEDPEDNPAAERAGELAGRLLPEIRAILEDPDHRVLQ